MPDHTDTERRARRFKDVLVGRGRRDERMPVRYQLAKVMTVVVFNTVASDA